MGNRFSCCKTHGESIFKHSHRRRRQQQQQQQSRRRRKDCSQTTNSDIKYDETILSLQHISERELPETNHDPSTNPTAGPLFVQRSATFTNNINHYQQQQQQPQVPSHSQSSISKSKFSYLLKKNIF